MWWVLYSTLNILFFDHSANYNSQLFIIMMSVSYEVMKLSPAWCFLTISDDYTFGLCLDPRNMHDRWSNENNILGLKTPVAALAWNFRTLFLSF